MLELTQNKINDPNKTNDNNVLKGILNKGSRLISSYFKILVNYFCFDVN